jgi:hypothetical protein
MISSRRELTIWDMLLLQRQKKIHSYRRYKQKIHS